MIDSSTVGHHYRVYFPSLPVTSSSFQFRKAIASDAEAIADLVNSGYRGEGSRAGWTTEADYLVGKRTDANEVRDLVAESESLILLCFDGEELVGSVHLQRNADEAYLGMFVVDPRRQRRGIGKHFMKEAERRVAREWGAKRVAMTVITFRHELIAYYERRGYRRTGEFKPFPIEDTRSTALVDGLKFEVLEKEL